MSVSDPIVVRVPNASAHSETSLDALERRVAGVVREYDAQGDHRTGTDVDDT